MSTDFVKLKGKMRLALIVKSLLFALSLGIIAASVYVIFLKFAALTPNILIFALIGIAVFAAAFGVLLLVIRPTDKRLAVRLDRKLSLGEKVQTMVEFDGKSGDMIEVQRADTNRIISSTPRKALADKKPYLHIIAPLLAIALILPAFLMGVKKPDVPPVPEVPENTSDVWELTDWHIMSVRLLIDDVNASALTSDGKSKITYELEGLLSDLANVTSRTKMTQTVIDVMIEIDGVVDGINTFSSVNAALKNSVSARVKELAVALGTPSDPILESKFSQLQKNMLQENAEDELNNFSAALKLVYETAGDAEKSDKLYLSLKSFADAAEELADVIAAPDFAGDKEALFTALFSAAGEKMSEALMEQKKNRDVSDNTINGLMSIFGIEYSEIPEELKYGDDGEAGGVSGENPDKNDDEHIVTGGGKGEGETLYASDDMIFDKDEGEHVKYGDVIDSYDVKKTDVVNNSSLPDNVKDAISKYFGDLYYNKDKD